MYKDQKERSHHRDTIVGEMHRDTIEQQEDFERETNVEEEPPYWIYAND